LTTKKEGIAMKYHLIALTAAIVTLVAFSVRLTDAQERSAARQEKSSIWMKKKLELSQNILAGLTESDFEKIRANAEAMGFLGYLEKWVRADRPDYKRQISHFEFANQELIRQARDENVEGATLAYTQLTVSCVQCHKIVRDVKK
jgi:hypothetical protein